MSQAARGRFVDWLTNELAARGVAHYFSSAETRAAIDEITETWDIGQRSDSLGPFYIRAEVER